MIYVYVCVYITLELVSKLSKQIKMIIKILHISMKKQSDEKCNQITIIGKQPKGNNPQEN